MKKLVFTGVTLLILCGLILGGCSSPAPAGTSSSTPPGASSASSSPLSSPAVTLVPSPGSAVTPKYGGTLRCTFGPVIPNLGWPASFMDGAAQVSQFSLETLLRGDSQGRLHPWLAESYKVADDLKSITFTIRKEVKFHDGSDLNAEVVKWNLDQFLQPSSSGGAPSGGMPPGGPPSGGPPAGGMPGGAPPAGGPSPGGPSAGGMPGGAPPGGAPPAGGAAPGMGVSYPWASVDILDDYTVRVNFTKWDNTLPYSFADSSAPIFMVSKAAYDKNGVDWMRSHPVGTGPFKFVSFQQDVSAKFVKNPDYWIKGRPYLDGIELTLVADPLTRSTMMMSGEADMTTVDVGQTAAKYESSGIIVKINIESNHYLIPDTADADSPWAKKEVREAAEYAIDKEAISKAMGYGYTQAPYQVPPRGSTAYNPNFTSVRKYDLGKAKQLLAQAGYPNGFKTTLIAAPFDVNKDVCVAIQDYLARAGIQVELDYPEIGRWSSYQYPGSWPKNSVVFLGIPMMDITFTQGLQFMFGMVGQNWARLPEVMQAYEKALAAPTSDINLIRAMTNPMSRDSLLIPVAEGGAGTAIKPYVMDTGILERGSSTLWNSENAWLNK